MPEEAYRSGAAFAVTIATHRRHRVLEDAGLANICIHALRESAVHYAARVFAYYFMPDHAHLLACVPDGSLIDFVRHFKQLSAYRAKPFIGANPLWQSRFYDRALRSEDALSQVARYILFNPVRAGLAQDVTGYSYSGSFVWPGLLLSGSEAPGLHSRNLSSFVVVLDD